MLVPGSLTVGATFELPMPADCKAPDIALEINSLSSVGLNCEMDAVVSGKDPDGISDLRRFADTAGVVLFDAWRLESRLGGMLMKN